MKKLNLILPVFLLILILTGCGKSNNESALRFDMTAFPHSIDPQTTSEKESETILLNTMSGLMKFTENGEAVPDLCESYTVSDDKKVYTFKLKENLLWEDGRPLTAHDFEFALKRAVSPKTNSPHAHRYVNILNAGGIIKGNVDPSNLGVRALDDLTLEIRLSSPDPSFLSLMAQSSSLPCNEEFFYSCKGKYGLSIKAFLANGPFAISSKEENLMLLKRNENSLNPAKNEKLYLCIDRGDITQVFLDGRSESCIVPFKDYEKISSYPFKAMYNQTYALVANPKSALGENDILRKNVMMSALDPSIEEKLSEGIIKADGIIPPATNLGSVNYREKAGSVTFPPLSDYSLLKEETQGEIKNLPKEEFPKTEMLTGDDDRNFSIASALQSIWSGKLSVYININPLPEGVLSKDVSSGNFDIALAKVNPPQDKPEAFLRAFQDFIVTVDGETKTVGEHLLDIKVTESAYLTSRQYLKIENALINQHYVLPVYHSPTFFVTAKNTEGIEYIPAKQAVYFGNAVLKEK